jgi:hypothetical protein
VLPTLGGGFRRRHQNRSGLDDPVLAPPDEAGAGLTRTEPAAPDDSAGDAMSPNRMAQPVRTLSGHAMGAVEGESLTDKTVEANAGLGEVK